MAKSDDYNEKNIPVKALVSSKMLDDYNNGITYQNNGLRNFEDNKGTFAKEQPELLLGEILDKEDVNDDLKMAEQQRYYDLEEKRIREQTKQELLGALTELIGFLRENPEILVGVFKAIKRGAEGIKKAGSKAVSVLNGKKRNEAARKRKVLNIDSALRNNQKICQSDNKRIMLTEEQARELLKETVLAYVKAQQGADILSKASVNGENVDKSAEQILEKISELKTLCPNILDQDTKLTISNYLEFNNDEHVSSEIKRVMFE